METGLIEQAAQAERDRNFKWNYTFHCTEGGMFECGLLFINIMTVLPLMVKKLGGPSWLVGMAPALMPVGFMLPSLFSAAYSEHLRKFKPFNLAMGVITRLIILCTAIILFTIGDSHRLFSAWVVALTPFLMGIPLGISSPSWFSMVGNMFPEKRLSSGWAIRLGIGTLCGIPIAYAIKKILAASPGPKGYGFLFLCTFGALLISYVLFAMLREIPGRPFEKPPTLMENLKLAPRLIRDDSQLRTYMLAVISGGTVFFVVPHLSHHAISVLDKPESFIGILLMWQCGGTLLGNLLGGLLGDMKGSRNVLLIGQSCEVILCILCLFASGTVLFYLIFVLVGLVMMCERIGSSTMTIEISPENKRPTYAGIISFGSLISMMLSGGLGGGIMAATGGNLKAAAIPGIVFSALSVWFLYRLKEPRTTHAEKAI